MTTIPTSIRTHLLAHPDQRPADAAADLGVPLSSIYTYRSLLIRAGALVPLNPVNRVREALAWLRQHPAASANALMAAVGCGHNTAARARRIARAEGWLHRSASDRLRADPRIGDARPCDLARAHNVSKTLASAVQSKILRKK